MYLNIDSRPIYSNNLESYRGQFVSTKITYYKDVYDGSIVLASKLKSVPIAVTLYHFLI